MTMVI